MLSTREVSIKFNVTRATIYNWELKGILKPVMISPTGRKFYNEEDIQKLYDSSFDRKRDDHLCEKETD